MIKYSAGICCWALASTALWLALSGCTGDKDDDPCAKLGPHDVWPEECVSGCFVFGPPEGGEVRFESMEWPALGCGDAGDKACGPEGITSATRVTAYQLLAMTPDAMTFPNVGGCTSLVNLDTWPTGQGMRRSYAEMGELSISTGASSLEVPAADSASPDPLGRSHDNYNFYFGADTNARFVTPNTAYDVNWTGDGVDSPARELPAGIYMPGPYTLLEPPFAANTEVVNTGEFALSWGDEGNAQIPEGTGPGMLSLVAFFIPELGMTHLCLGPDTGEIVVPSAMIQEAAALAGETGKATLVRAKLTHQLQEVHTSEGNTCRRIDMIGSYSYLSDITFVDPG